MIDREARLDAMVAQQIAARGVRDGTVLTAMRAVPRDLFIDPAQAAFAFDDTPLPIGEGQTITPPYVVAVMLEAARIKASDAVLEVGAGSGYLAALIGRMARKVIAIERQLPIANAASERLSSMGYANVEIRAGDGTEGCPEAAPFDAILVSAGGPAIPPPLRAQLAIGGRLVMPIGHGEGQHLVCLLRSSTEAFDQNDLGPVRFVPLIGAHGWPTSSL